METLLFESELIRLAAPDPDADAEIESRWTRDPDYLHLLDAEPARPLAPIQIRKQLEEAQKDKDLFRFAIRTRADDRLVGFIRSRYIEWANGVITITMGIGEESDRNRGYGAQALALVVHYAFAELNLHRVTVSVPGYNQGAIRFFERAGFRVEVRRRQAIHRYRQRWDVVMLGLLRHEWSGERRDQNDTQYEIGNTKGNRP